MMTATSLMTAGYFRDEWKLLGLCLFVCLLLRCCSHYNPWTTSEYLCVCRTNDGSHTSQLSRREEATSRSSGPGILLAALILTCLVSVLQLGFEHLHQLLPSTCGQSVSKVSKASMLQKGKCDPGIRNVVSWRWPRYTSRRKHGRQEDGTLCRDGQTGKNLTADSTRFAPWHEQRTEFGTSVPIWCFSSDGVRSSTEARETIYGRGSHETSAGNWVSQRDHQVTLCSANPTIENDACPCLQHVPRTIACVWGTGFSSGKVLTDWVKSTATDVLQFSVFVL